MTLTPTTFTRTRNTRVIPHLKSPNDEHLQVSNMKNYSLFTKSKVHSVASDNHQDKVLESIHFLSIWVRVRVFGPCLRVTTTEFRNNIITNHWYLHQCPYPNALLQQLLVPHSGCHYWRMILEALVLETRLAVVSRCLETNHSCRAPPLSLLLLSSSRSRVPLFSTSYLHLEAQSSFLTLVKGFSCRTRLNTDIGTYKWSNIFSRLSLIAFITLRYECKTSWLVVKTNVTNWCLIDSNSRFNKFYHGSVL